MLKTVTRIGAIAAALAILAACGGGRLASAIEARQAASGSSTAMVMSSPVVSQNSQVSMLSAYGRQIQLFQAGPGPRPTVLILHGGLSSVSKMQAKAPIGSDLAARGINAAYLYGTPTLRVGDRAVWNAGACCAKAVEQNVDDIGYISAAISTLVSQGIADPNRVYLLGHSNGGMMAYRFACTRPGQIRGVIGLAAPFVAGRCQNASGVQVLHIHGMRDDTVPINGGGKGVQLSGSPFPSVQQTLSQLRNAGANTQVIYLDGAEHQVDTIEAAARRELGQSIGAYVAGFVQ